MTSVEVPYSIASALPSLTVLDITNEVRRELAGSGGKSGIAFVSPLDDVALVRVQERESGFFCDLEDLLNRLVPQEQQDRERLLCMLLGPRGEQIPFSRGELCLGRWQRILLVDFEPPDEPRCALTLLG
jgi:thiamine phosphate synthase YjbQ (UPF0047 family)